MPMLLLPTFLFSLTPITVFAVQNDKASPFLPFSRAEKLDASEPFEEPSLSDEELKARDKAFDELVATFKTLNERVPRTSMGPFDLDSPRVPRLGSSILASPEFAVGFLAVGAVGWIGLGIGAYIVQRRTSR